MSDPSPAPAPAPAPATRKRVRLAPAARKRLILDAALGEFATHGFGATSTEKIAQRAGLSQTGLYAHFESKEAILTALLRETPMPQWDLLVREDEPLSAAAIDAWVDLSYERVTDPGFQSVFRILIAESYRIPHLLGDWQRDVVAPQRAEQQRILDTLLARGAAPRCTLTEHAELIMSPLVHTLMICLMNGGRDADALAQQVVARRESHRQFLKEQFALDRHTSTAPAEADVGNPEK